MIRLDWDAITLGEARRRAQLILLDSRVSGLRVCLSPTDGFHVYVETLYQLNPMAIIRLRNEWKDDGNRLVKDLLEMGMTHRDVLFKYKYKNGLKWSERELWLIKKSELSLCQ